ncbi:7301_t:CDS:2 [Paraglomus occultum]|uniref:Dihydrolipoamide acetyltransferase component of pyruvate dehydrogenase complex n=1 Tax=Paraglomus occultum TaxID=144539 RepID=A0A9N8ZTB3_9GLOM|nr:7301_t:CDS:2 [Paraglomus occultum]
MSLTRIRRAVQTPTLNAARSIRCNSSTGFSTTLRYYSSKHFLGGSFGVTLSRNEASSAFARLNVGGLSNVTLNRHTPLNPFLLMQARNYAEKVIPVPPMAESISEGTLKAWNKQVGDFVQTDEEVATIETDKIDVTVNSPVSGTIIELYAEVDTNVTVGADLFKVELGDAPAEGAAPPKKESASAEAPPAQEKKPEKPDVSKKEAESAPPEIILKKHGIKLGFMSAFVKAAVYALQEVAVVNASIEGPDGGDTIVYRDYVDMSVAVATPKGLVTPVVRNAHLMSFIEIEKAIAELGQKVRLGKGIELEARWLIIDLTIKDYTARDGKITIEDMAGGTFTISNGGVFGSLMGTPIINMPQSAILGMHITKERPVAINGKVEIRPMMYIALTYDHRLIDGREAVTFLKTVKEQIEDPRRLLLDV